jgi:hypothetical protein
VVVDPALAERAWIWVNNATLPEEMVWTPQCVRVDVQADGSLKFSAPEGTTRS